MSKGLAAIFVLGLSSLALAQATDEELKAQVAEKFRDAERAAAEALRQRQAAQDDAELKTRILEKVRAKLAADRAALLKRIEKIIDEELAAPSPSAKKPTPGKSEPEGDAKVKDLERKMRLLEEQKETLAAEMAKAKRQAADEALREEARKDGPHDAEEAQEMFDNALELHDKDKNYREAIKLFKRIYYNFPKTRVGAISAYNAACGYALSGSKEEAIDWLEYSVKAGYNDFDHLRKDTDLDSLRNEKRYKKLLTDR
jgi:hypothetical protein